MTFNVEYIREELNLTDGESDLLAGAETGIPSQVNKTRIFAGIYIYKESSFCNKRLDKVE